MDRRLHRDGLNLTDAQREVVRLVVAGKGNADICAHTGMALGTVKTHLCGAFGALGVSTRSEVIARVAALSGVDLASHFDRLTGVVSRETKGNK